jgi:bacillithiol synthase
VNCTARLLPYELTGSFSGLVLDYVNGADDVKPLFRHEVSLEGVKKAIADRGAVPVNRPLLHQTFAAQYAGGATDAQHRNIESLLSDRTFTVCTAHQPNIFTGYLYFIYKILHVVRIAEELGRSVPGHHFVPVYYMGSEDNDLEELGQVRVDGIRYVWQTRQQGAVGRMKVDKPLLTLITDLEGQLGVQPYGADVIALLRQAYREGRTIAEATKSLVDGLFAAYGLLVLNADDAALKRTMIPVFRDDLTAHTPHDLVTRAGAQMHHRYKVQVNPREINLFYITDGIRERIIRKGDVYTTESGAIRMSADEILALLGSHPECFSPNVVLRALYQETILPDVAFVGGGSELAYWLEMKTLFDHFRVPMPVLVLRNSFLIADERSEHTLRDLGLGIEDLFLDEFTLEDKYVRMHSDNELDVGPERNQADALFAGLRAKASAIDPTLVQHVEALQAKFRKQLDNAEKKMVRAEKRKQDTGKDRVLKLRARLFPGGSLQERVDNFMPYYAEYGSGFIDAVYRHSPALEQNFVVMTLAKSVS